MLAQRADQLRMARLDLFQSQSSALLHQVHEAKIPGRDPHRLSAPNPGRRASFGVRSTGGLLDSMSDHRVVLVSSRKRRGGACRERATHEVGKAVAVSLPERRALCLSVIGEDDEL